LGRFLGMGPKSIYKILCFICTLYTEPENNLIIFSVPAHEAKCGIFHLWCQVDVQDCDFGAF
jgi:hypothetical protein